LRCSCRARSATSRARSGLTDPLLNQSEGHAHGCETGIAGSKKRELENKEETTIPARVFLPTTDIYETQDALTVILEMPGVEKSNVDIRVEDGVLHVQGQLDLSKYQGLQPLYTEYNIGHYARSFQLSSKIDQNKIGAELKEGVLALTLPKIEEAKPRRIEVS
jgi:HSP20 family molecular chaperone IbpA